MTIGKSKRICNFCDNILNKDEIGLNKKIFEYDSKKNIFRCINCAAEYLECYPEELTDKIEDFKNEGCKLFS